MTHPSIKPRPHRRVTVSAPATNRLLTTLARVKQSLGISDATQDTLLTELIARASDQISAYLRLPVTHDGVQPTLGRQTYIETIRDQSPRYGLFLSYRPLALITSLVEDGVTLVDGTDYETSAGVGAVDRLVSDEISSWTFEKAVITYTAGYILPNDEVNRNLPYDIEEAAIYTISARMSDLNISSGDREIRSESLDGVYSATYETTGATRFSGQGLPQRAVALLNKYRVPMV